MRFSRVGMRMGVVGMKAYLDSLDLELKSGILVDDNHGAGM